MSAELLSIIAPVFITVAIGYLWARLGRPFDAEFITNIVLTLATPCLVFAALSDLEVGLADSGTIAAVMLAALALYALGGVLILRLAGRLPLHSYLPSLMFGNLGNMGLPLSFFAFGETGLSLAVTAFAVHSVCQFTVGDSIAAWRVSGRQLLRTPILYGIVFSLPFMITGAAAPQWLDNTTNLLGDIVVPLMLLTLGVALSRLKVTRIKRSVLIAVTRLILGLAVGLLLSEVLGLEGELRGVTIIMTSMPLAVFNVVFATRYRREPEDVAAAIVISTAISFVTLPLLLMSAL